MNGIVSLLDSAHYQMVENVWGELQRRFGVGPVNEHQTYYPHFSYHVAERYDGDMLIPVLTQLVATTAAFTIHAMGLGVFTGEKPVLYVPIARQRPLLELQETLWPVVDRYSRGTSPYYAPPVWLPHITLAHVDVAVQDFGLMVQWLNQQDLNWHIRVDNIALLSADPDNLAQRFDFTG